MREKLITYEGQTGVFVPLEHEAIVRPRSSDFRYQDVEARIQKDSESISEFLRTLSEFTSHNAIQGVPDVERSAIEPYWNNGAFTSDDARLAFAFIAATKPKRVIEVGGGQSTRFMRLAVDHLSPNTEILSIDSASSGSGLGVARCMTPKGILDVPLSDFEALEEGDLLFYNGSHLTLNGTDTVRLFLEIMPRLRPGVVVNIHGISLPFEYTDSFNGRGYSEQYLLAAALLFGDHWQVLAPVSYLTVSGTLRDGGVSFWMRRNKPTNAQTPQKESTGDVGEANIQCATLPPRAQAQQAVSEIERSIAAQRQTDLLLDQLAVSVSVGSVRTAPSLTIFTDHPVAVESDDHLFPRGAASDDTRHPRFVWACERIFARPVRHLDIGCAGGGLVWDFLLRGHQSVGVEGSDFPLRSQLAYWRVIPHNLFTADATKPFRFKDIESQPQTFDVITAWEVLEHIPENSLAGFFDNVRSNLAPSGLFVCSIATFPDQDPESGAIWHVTVRPRDWWVSVFDRFGFEIVDGRFVIGDFVRGAGNPRAHDWNAEVNPELGFHLTAKAKS